MNKEIIYKYLVKYKNNEYIEDRYLNLLWKEGYTNGIENFNNNNYGMLLHKGELFLENYDNSLSEKLNSYLGKYPNISKLFYFLLGICIGLVPTIFKIFS